MLPNRGAAATDGQPAVLSAADGVRALLLQGAAGDAAYGTQSCYRRKTAVKLVAGGGGVAAMVLQRYPRLSAMLLSISADATCGR